MSIRDIDVLVEAASRRIPHRFGAAVFHGARRPLAQLIEHTVEQVRPGVVNEADFAFRGSIAGSLLQAARGRLGSSTTPVRSTRGKV